MEDVLRLYARKLDPEEPVVCLDERPVVLREDARRGEPIAPWQNGIAERWVGSVRRELLDHAVVFNEHHLRRLVGEYVVYYHQDRTDYALEKETPGGPWVAGGRGGLHHRYHWAA